MNISEVMTQDVKIVMPTDSLQSAAQLMQAQNCGALPVGEDG